MVTIRPSNISNQGFVDKAEPNRQSQPHVIPNYIRTGTGRFVGSVFILRHIQTGSIILLVVYLQEEC